MMDLVALIRGGVMAPRVYFDLYCDRSGPGVLWEEKGLGASAWRTFGLVYH